MKLHQQIRNQFTEFFQNNSHAIVRSSPLTPEDSTLLFTNSGMVQFKDYFAGNLESPHKRATTVQKCVRAGGKHNDLDNVGYTNRHHTFFEMLGNFSFGDYFKEEAIEFAWNFLTNEVKLDKNRLHITVYHTDDEAYVIWKKFVSEDKIIKISTKDNFWQVGNVGPCGPCSEIFYDYGDAIFGDRPGTKNEDGARFTEIWNLVFMQNFIHENGTITDLPKKNIDTGMGLERLLSVLEGTVDNYSTTLFRELIGEISDITKIQPSSNLFTANGDISKFSQNDFALRILSDHIRSISFLIADGVLPSNEGRGYVLRRIIRRALKSAYFAGVKTSFLPHISQVLINQMGKTYGELNQARELILAQTLSEEEKFMELLPRGIRVLEKEASSHIKNGVLAGDFAFKLYDTYGFPLDITLEIAQKYGVKTIDEKAFEREMEIQQQRSKKSWKTTNDTELDVLKKAISHLPETEFLGYDSLKCEAKTLYIQDSCVVFDRTVFYAESGGQSSDAGTISGIQVLDVQKIDGRFIHYLAENLPSNLQKVEMIVDAGNRQNISANHTATHLLHSVLRQKYGEALVQKGSSVRHDGFRFDFSHSKPITLAEIHEIELAVNARIAENLQTTVRICSKNDAEKLGAMALFGEKYGDSVRVISAGDSVELCGGIHVKSTGEIGFFKIISHGAVASGVRRIEAKTRMEAISHIHKIENEQAEIKEKFKATSSIMELVQAKENEISRLKLQEKQMNIKLANFTPVEKIPLGDAVASLKNLENFSGDIQAIAREIASDVRIVLNRQGDNFNFCLLSSGNAKNLAKEFGIFLGVDLKFGGSETFVTGGGTFKR